MEKDSSEPSHTEETNRGQKAEGSRPSNFAEESGHHDATLFAQIAAALGPNSTGLDHSFAQLSSSYPYLHIPTAPSFFNFPSGAMGNPQGPSASWLDFVWSHLMHQQSQHPMYTFPFPAELAQTPFLNPLQAVPTNTPMSQSLPERVRGSSASSSQSSQPPAQFIMVPEGATSASSPGGVGVDETDAERLSTAEDKRRRNTSASARFRIKKKQRTINLEQTVSDLTSRAEELEKEVTDLRRENGWLKEIVMLKGSRYAGGVALSQLLGIDLTDVGGGQPSQYTDNNPTTATATRSEDISSGEESDDDYLDTDKKKKGKKPAKGERK